MGQASSEWFGVRCLFRHEATTESPSPLYEERINLWRAVSFDEAIAAAEREAIEYAATVDAEYAGLAQAYRIGGEPDHGSEVFSLMRSSELPMADYLNHYFDDGNERQLST